MQKDLWWPNRGYSHLWGWACVKHLTQPSQHGSLSLMWKKHSSPEQRNRPISSWNTLCLGSITGSDMGSSNFPFPQKSAVTLQSQSPPSPKVTSWEAAPSRQGLQFLSEGQSNTQEVYVWLLKIIRGFLKKKKQAKQGKWANEQVLTDYIIAKTKPMQTWQREVKMHSKSMHISLSDQNSSEHSR